jgi:hypothetical protein
MHRILSERDDAAVQWPTSERMAQLASLVQARDARISSCFGFLDGLHLATQNSSEVNTQNAYYNSWLAGTTISCAYVFSPEGDVLWASLNCPGSWHDATVASHLMDRLLDPQLTPDPFFIIADSAFPHKGPIGRKIHTPLTRREPQHHSASTRSYSTGVVSMRQTVEWGMRGLQSKFPRLTVPLPINDRQRLIICKVSLLLYNVKVRLIGLSQIAEVFEDH